MVLKVKMVSMLIACGLLLLHVPADADNTIPDTYYTYMYRGCYVDSYYYRDLPNDGLINRLDMTIDICVAHCGSLGHMYAGLQYSNECWCGENYNSYGEADGADCNKPCSGNDEQYCGGDWRNSIYKLDQEPPANVNVITDSGSPNAIVSWAPPMASDNLLTSSHNPGDSFPIDRTIVTYTATDVANYLVPYSFEVVVTDTEIPDMFGLLEDMTVVMDTNLQSASVSWVPPTATDNSGEEVSVTSTHIPGDSFPIGRTTVTYIATDAYGNRASITFVVVVVAPKTTPAQNIGAETSTVTPTTSLKATTAGTLTGTLVGAVICTFAVVGLFAVALCVLIRKRRSEPEGSILPTAASRVASPENVTYQNTHDVLEDADNTYACTDVKRESAGADKGRQRSTKGSVPIYAHSEVDGRSNSHIADESAEEDSYSYADLKRKSLKDTNTGAVEGWSDNSVYAPTNDGNNLREHSGNKEGWKTNSTYASADSGCDHQESEGWEENNIYGLDD